MAKVESLPEPKAYAPKAAELVGRIKDLIAEYDGEMSTAEAIGVLEIVKIGMLE